MLGRHDVKVERPLYSKRAPLAPKMPPRPQSLATGGAPRYNRSVEGHRRFRLLDSAAATSGAIGDRTRETDGGYRLWTSNCGVRPLRVRASKGFGLRTARGIQQRGDEVSGRSAEERQGASGHTRGEAEEGEYMCHGVFFRRPHDAGAASSAVRLLWRSHLCWSFP